MHPVITQKFERIFDALPIEANPQRVALLESGASCATLAKPTTGRGNTQFAAETAAITSKSKSQVNRHLSRAEALGDDIDRLVGTSLD